jgi:hypothetical protein
MPFSRVSGWILVDGSESWRYSPVGFPCDCCALRVAVSHGFLLQATHGAGKVVQRDARINIRIKTLFTGRLRSQIQEMMDRWDDSSSLWWTKHFTELQSRTLHCSQVGSTGLTFSYTLMVRWRVVWYHTCCCSCLGKNCVRLFCLCVTGVTPGAEGSAPCNGIDIPNSLERVHSERMLACEALQTLTVVGYGAIVTSTCSISEL